MSRSLKSLVSFLTACLLIVVPSLTQAQPAPGTTPQVLPQPERDAFSACLTACQSQRQMCVTPGQANIGTDCAGVTECSTLAPDQVTQLNAWADACMQNVTPLCPGNCQPAGTGTAATPPTAGTGNTTTTPGSGNTTTTRRQPTTFEGRCRARGGVPATISVEGTDQPVCYTLQHAYQEIQTLKQQLAEAQQQIRTFQDRNEAVPASLVQSFDEHLKQLERLGIALYSMGDEQGRRIHNLVIQYQSLRDELDQVKRDVDLNRQNIETNRRDIVTLKQDRSSGGLTDGLAFGVYGTGQVYRLYGEELYAGGGEVAFYPNVWNSRLRPAFGMGVARAADYFDQTMVHLNVRGGVRYQGVFGADWLSVTFGAEHNRYALNVFEQARASYYGAFVEPRASILVDEDASTNVRGGNAVYLYVRPGLGWRNGRHGELPAGAPGAVTDHEVDIPVTAGLGYEFITF